MTSHLLSAEQAAARLGVKLSTVYAYVSRGLLSRTLAEDGRSSRFEPQEIEALARRGRPRGGTRPAGRIHVAISTSITGIVDGRLLYRGRDATELARDQRFEAVAGWLWRGEWPGESHFAVPGHELVAAERACARLPPGSPASERYAVATAALACARPLRVDLRPERVVQEAQLLLCGFVAVLPGPASPPAHRQRRSRTRRDTCDAAAPHLARALWPRLSPLPASRARVALLDTALVLLADHELATSTLAARVAASTRADPYGVVLAGLGAVSGPLHGKAALAVHRMLLDADSAPAVEPALERALLPGGQLPGFGHPVYAAGDPRCTCLLARMEALVPGPRLKTVRRIARLAAAAERPAPNVDFALGALAFCQRMPLGATEAIFALSRSAGWIAHALEEYTEAPLRFRARALYDGAR